MLFSIASDERAAMHFEDMASAFDAGLPLASLGGDASAGERVLHGALHKRGVRLSATEDAVLLQAWRAGKAGAALRGRAVERRRRAEFVRTLWAGLRYPLVLLLMVLMASAATSALVGPGFFYGVVITYGALTGLGFGLRAAVRRGALWIDRIPVLSRLIAGLAELPYLETLQALYGAGVQLGAAHHAALGTVRAGAVANRLQIADRILQTGRPLREALAEAAALHPETRNLLATGEQAGQLEDALGRALARRRDVTSRELIKLARWAGQAAYLLAVVACAIVILRGANGYFSLWRR